VNGLARRGSAVIATFGALTFASIAAAAQDELPAPPPAETTPSSYGEMQTGGLTPPPMSESTAHGSTERELDDAKKNDGKRGLFLGLTRPGVDASTIQTLEAHHDVNKAEAAALSLDGSSYGSALSVAGVLALHF
jgi:hypothetical protein